MGGESGDWFWESGLGFFYMALAFSDLLLPGVVPEVQAQLPLSMPQEAFLVAAAVAGGGLQTMPRGPLVLLLPSELLWVFITIHLAGGPSPQQKLTSSQAFPSSTDPLGIPSGGPGWRP